MTRRARTKPISAPASGPAPRKRLLAIGLLAGAVLVGVLVAFLLYPKAPEPAADSPAAGTASSTIAARYVGAEACRTCHENEYRAWRGSHHQLAMQEANAATVLGDFADVRFKHQGVESVFFRRGDRYLVRTDGPDGRLTDYEIAYTFGVYPLQQYLIAFPGGRYQVLPIAWDARPQGEGGQRWFHLYPKQRVDHRDPLHWTGVYQNWALQCAECHSTHLRKGYDAATHTYQTTFSEINVACESCHGPASVHVEWARNAKSPYAESEGKGLPAMRSRWNEAWKFPGDGARFAVRDRPADAAGMNSCAACHSRRSTLTEERKPGAPLEDSHRLAMLTAPNYHADGQQREEVYVWGSFLQSRMHQRGVTCMDCHDPHSQKLRAEGNALCTRCHAAAAFDTPAHHHHAADGKGAACVACHMPTQNYMVIHARQDHSLRIPRPDLSIALGSPNACTQCHADRRAQWAASAMDRWYGTNWRVRAHFGTTLHAGETQGVRALPDLLELAANTAFPAIVRATALTLAQPYVTPTVLSAARPLLRDTDASVRIAALALMAPADPGDRVASAGPLLDDPVRGVRVEAARVLADIPDAQLAEGRRITRATALREYEEALALGADWPSGQVHLGDLRLRQGRPDEAIAAFASAIDLDARFSDAYVNLADTYRRLGREADAERTLLRGLAALPSDADLHHALGLLLVRKGDKAGALREFVEAVRLAPGNARYAYVRAIAVDSVGTREQALLLLRSAHQRYPNDVDILVALLSMSREAGDRQAALAYARQLAALLPDNADLGRLLAELEAR